MSKSRKGSMEYWPHRRAHRLLPRIRSLPQYTDAQLLSFVAFKVGMTHVMMMDDSESPAKGTEVARAVTVLEIPKVNIYGIRFYKKGYADYRVVAGEIYDPVHATKLGIKKIENNDISKLKEEGKLDVSALAYLDASTLEFGNKRLMRFEISVSGKDAATKLAFIQPLLGKEIKATDFLKTGEFLDVSSVSKGRGWAGVVKRFGVSRQYRKATNKVRHVGTLGPWHPAKVMFTVPHSGHKGYNYRTELNKRVLKVGTPADISSINVKGGFLHYGPVTSDFVVIDGSISGSAKRLVRLRKSLRNGHLPIKVPVVNHISLQSKQ